MFYGEAVVTTATAERRCCLIMLIHDYPAIEHRKNVFLNIYYDHKRFLRFGPFTYSAHGKEHGFHCIENGGRVRFDVIRRYN